MKLADHAEKIRQLIDKSFRNRLGRMGIVKELVIGNAELGMKDDKSRLLSVLVVLRKETANEEYAFEKLVEELSFTLFNRMAALKVMEANTLHPEIITRRSQHGDRSFAHKLYLENNPDKRGEEQEGLLSFFEYQLTVLAGEIPLFSLEHPYHLLPTPIELNAIIQAFNQVDSDAQVETEIWKSDDVLGWLYESYNNAKKAAHKESGDKTEFHKVSIQSQVYTPRWVVKFLVDNSLGKFYLEMYPDSAIRGKYKIAIEEFHHEGHEAHEGREGKRKSKPLTEIRLIDPATGSGNFLLYAFDLFYDLYLDQIENYGADYDDTKIPELILKHNLYGIDLDDRAIQLAQLGLYIKAKRKKRNTKIEHFHIVSSDFYLPDFSEVKHLFQENDKPLVAHLEKIVLDLWTDLQQAYKFGSLIRLEEKLNSHLQSLANQWEGDQLSLSFIANETLAGHDQFRINFFTNLQKAVEQNTVKQGVTFLNTKTADAITFLQLITQKYDIAVANPPYTDSSDFGPELKTFIEDNYKKPHKFHSNLYATFIKRCYELIDDRGKMALVHPQTFMYIKTFEEVRKFIIEKLHISLFVEWGYLGMFNPLARVDSVMYIFEKEKKEVHTNFIKLSDIYEGKRYKVLFEAYDDLLSNRPNKHNYTLDQSKLKIIEGNPFIYWISDGFREKFKGKVIENCFYICNGISSGGNNERFYRHSWEVNKEDISLDYLNDKRKWVIINKGGGFNKWYGNLWLLFEWADNGKQLKELKKSVPSIRHGYEEFYFKDGLSFSGATSKGLSVRYQPSNCIFERAGKSIFKKEIQLDYYYTLAYLNSSLSLYIIDCLNPTVNTQSGDIERLPFVTPSPELEQRVSALAAENIAIKKHLCSFRIIETNFAQSPLRELRALRVEKEFNHEGHEEHEGKEEKREEREMATDEVSFPKPLRALRGEKEFNHEGHEEHEGREDKIKEVKEWTEDEVTMHKPLRDLRALRVENSSNLKDRLLHYLHYENALLTQVLLNEAIINELIFEVYELSEEDRKQVETKMGKPVGSLPVIPEALDAYKQEFNHEAHEEHEGKEESEMATDEVSFPNPLRDLRALRGEISYSFDEAKVKQIKEEFNTLYQANNDLEEFCIRHQVNPINVWYWFKEARILPSARSKEVALEFIADAVRTMLAEDDDGIIPLVGQLGEERLVDRLEKHCLEKGFSSAQYMQLEGLLGKSLDTYLEENFFKDLSDHLNLFMYLPKTPFIWHLSSGEHKGLELYVSIYRWSRDNLFRLKSAYIAKRIENLEFRQIQIQDSNTAQAQNEKETLRNQLHEIKEFSKKIDELIAENYNPKLDDGVGKNIAPLQKKGLLKYEVLNKKQLEKYLKADW
jgi:hypothetical protein